MSGNQLTILSVPTYFVGTRGLIQHNAISCWGALNPRPEIILFGHAEGVPEYCSKYEIQNIPHIECNAFDTPILEGVFLHTQQLGTIEYLRT